MKRFNKPPWPLTIDKPRAFAAYLCKYGGGGSKPTHIQPYIPHLPIIRSQYHQKLGIKSQCQKDRTIYIIYTKEM